MEKSNEKHMTKIRVVGMEGAPKGPLGSRDFCHFDPSLNACICSYTLLESYRTVEEIPNPRVTNEEHLIDNTSQRQLTHITVTESTLPCSAHLRSWLETAQSSGAVLSEESGKQLLGARTPHMMSLVPFADNIGS